MAATLYQLRLNSKHCEDETGQQDKGRVKPQLVVSAPVVATPAAAAAVGVFSLQVCLLLLGVEPFISLDTNHN